MTNKTTTHTASIPQQEDVNIALFEGLKRLEQRLDTLAAPAPATSNIAEMQALAAVLQGLTAMQQPQQPQQQPAQQPAQVGISGESLILASTLGKNGKPLRVKREELLFGNHPATDDIVAAALHAEAVDSAYAYGIVAEPSEGLSPWAIAGIAVGAAALGAGVAIGVSYAMNSGDE